jgi:outer membrane lipoprotein-sorting protein
MTARCSSSFAAALGALGVLAASPGRAAAQSFTSGDQVVRAMHDKYQSTWYHTLTFTQKTTRRTPADTMVVETWYESAAVPGRLRIDIAPRPGGRSIIFANDSIFVTRGDSVLRRVAGRYPLLILGFDVYGQSPERTMEVLRAEGFNLAPVHEDTWKGRKVYVVGANAGDLRSKQFWVDKERLLFVRLLEPSRADSTKMDDTRFDDYQRLGGGWIAPTVESYSGGKLVQREEYRDIKADPALPDGLFTVGSSAAAPARQ